MTISFKEAHFPQDIILIGVWWYLACAKLSKQARMSPAKIQGRQPGANGGGVCHQTGDWRWTF